MTFNVRPHMNSVVRISAFLFIGSFVGLAAFFVLALTALYYIDDGTNPHVSSSYRSVLVVMSFVGSIYGFCSMILKLTKYKYIFIPIPVLFTIFLCANAHASARETFIFALLVLCCAFFAEILIYLCLLPTKQIV